MKYRRAMTNPIRIRDLSPDSRYWYYKEKHANWYAANKKRADMRATGRIAEMPPLVSLRKPLTIEEKRAKEVQRVAAWRQKQRDIKKAAKDQLIDLAADK